VNAIGQVTLPPGGVKDLVEEKQPELPEGRLSNSALLRIAHSNLSISMEINNLASNNASDEEIERVVRET
jgi:hypothetical protein